MGLRFYRRVKVLPGMSVNFSGSGPSLTFGARGAHVTVGRRGVTRTVGIPGTGIWYTSRSGHHSGAQADGRAGGWTIVVVLAVVAWLLWSVTR
jgi:Protein of unknown function (DUF4236)